jgi:exodeoxyribonuclease V alpha subunit
MANDGAVTIRGRVLRLFHRGASFSAGTLLDSRSGRVRKWAGKCMPEIEDQVVVRGRIVTHPKFGEQIEVDEMEHDLDLDDDGLRVWLAKSDAAKGIGPSRAAAIVSACSGRFEETISSAEKRATLAEKCRIPVAVLESLAVEWEARRALNVASVELARWGISPGKARKLVEAHGLGVVRVVAADPYWLIGRVERFGFATVDEFAMRGGISRTHPSRLRACVAAIVSGTCESDGCTWVPRDVAIADAVKALRIDQVVDGGSSLVAETISAMAAACELEIVVADGGVVALFLPSLLAAERTVRRKLAEAASMRGIAPETRDEDVAAANPSALAGQVRAIATALRNRVSIITGGAGVGKTFCVEAIVRACESTASGTVALCAPTGKAARRMSEMTGREASTIHRLLEAKPGGGSGDEVGGAWRFGRNSGNPIEADLVVVDEVSMVDVRLMASLLSAIDLSRTSLLLVGDHHQLPSVGAGAVLRDAIAGGVVSVSELDEVVRQAGELKRCVAGTLDGRVAETSPDAAAAAKAAEVEFGPPPRIAPWYVFRKNGPDEIVALVRDLFEGRVERYGIERNGSIERISAGDDVQVLTPMHKGPIGTRALNAMIQGIVQRRRGVEVLPRTGDAPARPLAGDRVVYLKNDADLGVTNGATGYVLAVESGGAMSILFDGSNEPTDVPESKRDAVSLAYAMTVHKSQGSEFPVVVFVCAKPHTIMHHRGLFYTAVSRARQACLIVGDAWAVANCARTVREDSRRSLATIAGAE